MMICGGNTEPGLRLLLAEKTEYEKQGHDACAHARAWIDGGDVTLWYERSYGSRGIPPIQINESVQVLAPAEEKYPHDNSKFHQVADDEGPI